MNPRSIILGVMIVAISFIGATLAINVLWPRAPASLKEGRPALVAVPPLKPLEGVSTVLAPAAITMAAIGEALEAQAPRDLAGKRPGAVSPLMPDADIHWTITRGPLNVSGQSDSLVVATPLSGASRRAARSATPPTPWAALSATSSAPSPAASASRSKISSARHSISAPISAAR